MQRDSGAAARPGEGTYLMVLPVPHFRLPDGRCATESPFATHLRMLRDSLAPVAGRLIVAGPVVSAERYASLAAGWSVLDASADRIGFLPLMPAGLSRFRRMLSTPAIAARLWRAVGTARVVHSGASELFTPMENLGLLIGALRGKVLVFVEDIDWRESARMNRLTGAWSAGVAWRRRHIHDAWKAAQVRAACRFADVVMLKGLALVRDFGRGRPNVHLILDAAHSGEMVLAGAELEERAAAFAQPGPLRAVYFGRLTAYKGVDRMIRAVHAARRAGAEVTLDIFGDGEQRAELEALSGGLGLAEQVRFHGTRAYGIGFLRELSAFDLLLAAPLSEDTPRSALDAQARGIPVLAFDTYYYRDLAESGAGVLCTPWNDDAALAAALAELAAHRERLAPLARAGVAFAAANTQEAWLEKRARWMVEACA